MKTTSDWALSDEMFGPSSTDSIV